MKVCLDAGHYKGYNVGYYKQYAEGTAMFDYMGRLAKRLTACGIEVVTTKKTVEENPSLTARGTCAKGCDLFVSLHSNGVNDTSAHGVSTFYSIKRDGDRIAAQNWCDKLANLIGTRSRGATTRQGGGDWDYYTVIQYAIKANCPHVFLIEHSFHSNPQECKWLMQSENLERMAELECDLICGILNVDPKKAKETPAVLGKKTVNTPGDTLNVRTEPVYTADKIGELPDGAKVETLGVSSNGWVKVKYTIEGWVNGTYLK